MSMDARITGKVAIFTDETDGDFGDDLVPTKQLIKGDFAEIGPTAADDFEDLTFGQSPVNEHISQLLNATNF
ncbi:hypothetical protein BGZ80_006841 [Entomortierella chlamydospora]|uniref:Uncharacterized protein n=1 Tax=Entomortierella chlamydospora TaxID=101097 RepID=A0A9P6MYK1_9FUNG|nr:hypothetical protein BGZ79_008509 [Entomortierella chlamydospora]KAG0018718.1 hypothetical protein BGZ80_006841 [Entomortierella chlamydospora]